MKKVIEKVRKLIALGTNSGATEGERDNAIRMAHGLLAKHNLVVSDLEEITESRIQQFSEYQNKPWAGVTVNAIAKLFFCSCYGEEKRANIPGTGTKRKIFFIGKEANVTAAILMADYVITAIRRERNRNKYSYSFCNGASAKISQRVQEIINSSSIQDGESTCTDLALVSVYKTEEEANQEFISKEVGLLKQKKYQARNNDALAYFAGCAYGNGISLNNQVGGSKSTTKSLT